MPSARRACCGSRARATRAPRSWARRSTRWQAWPQSSRRMHAEGLAGAEVVLARYGELWLKGKNRADFERALVRNCRVALFELDPEVRFERVHGLLVVRPSRRTGDVARRLQDVFGLASLSP